MAAVYGMTAMANEWTRFEDIDSERARRAVRYGDIMASIVNRESDETFDALLPLIDSERFVRRGNERTEMDWASYRSMLEQWAEHCGRYEKTLHRACEAGDRVWLDLDERARAKEGTVGALRSVSIYEFDVANRIIAVDICMGFHQQPG